jgi:hypothetical protein
LTAMLHEAPSEDGRCYVAVALRAAHDLETRRDNPCAVIDLAKAWKQHLFRPSSFLQRSPSPCINSFRL